MQVNKIESRAIYKVFKNFDVGLNYLPSGQRVQRLKNKRFAMGTSEKKASTIYKAVNVISYVKYIKLKYI